jgi:TolA-binding protein
MRRYGYSAFAVVLLLIVGAGFPNNNDKELIIRLQGEILVLQRQIRDLQESFDKWQVKSETSLSKLGNASDFSTQTLSSIDDKLQRNQGAQSGAITGINSHLAKISEQVSINNQQISQLNQNINTLKQSVQEYQHKLRERENLEIKQSNDDPEFTFATGYLKFKNREYDAAISAFRNYLKISGQPEKSDDAAFWIAESLAAQGKLAEALNEYNEIQLRYPKGDKAAIAQFRIGVVLLRQEKRVEGVDALKTVMSLYPDSREAAMARSELTRLGEMESSASPTAPSATPRQRPQR